MILFRKSEDKPSPFIPDARMTLALKGNEDVKSHPFPPSKDKNQYDLSREWREGPLRDAHRRKKHVTK